MGWEGRNDAVEIARQEKNRWKKRALNAEATLAKVREEAERVQRVWAGASHSPYDGGYKDAMGTVLSMILDESPTERETPAKAAFRKAEAEGLRRAANRLSPLSREMPSSLDIALVRDVAYRAADAMEAARGEEVPDDRA